MQKVYKAGAILALAFVVFCGGGCRSIVKLFRADDPIDTEVIATWFDGPRIRPGVHLVVQVSTANMPPVTMSCVVDSKGEIVLQHLLSEPVSCDGLRLDALKDKLTKAYQVYYKQPQVTVNFASDGSGVSPWGSVTVLGEVGSPGPVNMSATDDMTVTRVLKMAGGLRTYADKTNIRVTRCDREGRQTRYTVDIEEIGEEGRPDKDMILKAGDVVWVPTTWY